MRRTFQFMFLHGLLAVPLKDRISGVRRSCSIGTAALGIEEPPALRPRDENKTGRKRMNEMKKLMVGSGMVALAGLFMIGCASTRDAVQKEYERLTSLPAAEQVVSPNKQVNDVGRASSDLYNVCHAKLKNYVAATENHREYTGFMNDVQTVIKDEGLSEEDAMAKVCALVQEEDKTRSDAEKVWPRIMQGWAAANALEPAKQLTEIASLVVRNQEIVNSANDLPKSFEKEDYMSKAKRGAEAAKIGSQAAQTTEMLLFLGEQFRRVQKLKTYK